ncbi:DUF397 domain-containing protein [Streptomyces avicenniae]|uniref:DUF397 domain-containing protein n=1 Tax=Streptomyces avicenniae TaxID=500153 RepID=UPI00069C6304|nr:DUF397 domain-containing protein [Streptomyces avicenniae]
MSTDLDLSTTEWQTSSYTNTTGGSCVEVGFNIPGMHPVRDTKNRIGAVIVFTTPAWGTFLKHLK